MTQAQQITPSGPRKPQLKDSFSFIVAISHRRDQRTALLRLWANSICRYANGALVMDQ
jgi:hypothetical protein